jgi:hypothetical protein
MRVNRRRGHVRINLEAVEAGLLSTLFDDLGGALAVLPDDDPVRQRLFPSAYPDDEAAASEFRELTEDSLHDARVERLEKCRAELPSADGNVELDDEAAQRWLTVLNDLRLAIGTRLNVSEDDELGIDPADPDAQTRAIYHWLTALQDSLVRAVAG